MHLSFSSVNRNCGSGANLELLTLAGCCGICGKCLRLSKRAEEKPRGVWFSQLETESTTYQRDCIPTLREDILRFSLRDLFRQH